MNFCREITFGEFTFYGQSTALAAYNPLLFKIAPLSFNKFKFIITCVAIGCQFIYNKKAVSNDVGDIKMELNLANLQTKDFYYDLPKDLIAQTPLEPRDSSRLLMLSRDSGEITHKHFYDIIDCLNPGDCLVLNDSRVLPARLYGIKDGTGAKVEFL